MANLMILLFALVNKVCLASRCTPEGSTKTRDFGYQLFLTSSGLLTRQNLVPETHSGNQSTR